jgi:RimJ/RimL family protein N-acetyltransferase
MIALAGRAGFARSGAAALRGAARRLCEERRGGFARSGAARSAMSAGHSASPGARREGFYDRGVQSGPRLTTERLLLRRWLERDRAPFAAMNADGAVMEHVPATLSRAESNAMIARAETCFERRGYGLWAIEIPGEAPFIGFTGLSPVAAPMPFAPAVEIGWRLARRFWGRGLASEAAAAALEFGFSARGLQEIVSFTAVGNRRSRAVMERLGMRRESREDFDHPLLDEADRLRRHVLYRLDVTRWRSGAANPKRHL